MRQSVRITKIGQNVEIAEFTVKVIPSIIGEGTGGGGDFIPFVFTQLSPLQTWTVNHNRGYRPNITILSTGGVEIEAEIHHVSVNQVQVMFSQPFAGQALC